MKHLNQRIQLLLASIFLCLASHAYDAQVGGIYYNLNSSSKTAEVTYKTAAYNSYSGSVTIPAKITYEGMQYSVTLIDNYAFYKCPDLTSITIPNSVISIGVGAFEDCSKLASIIIPNSVTSIGGRAFSNCIRLTSIEVENGNPRYDSRNNCNAIIETRSNKLIAGCENTVIPNSVTNIGEHAYTSRVGLTSLTIPNSVTTIGDYAFYNCSGLTSVTIPNSVTNIGNGTFSSCSSLTLVTIPNSVTTIGTFAFDGCSGLTSVTIPNSVTSIGYNPFRACSHLNSIKVENGNPKYDSRNNCNAIIETSTNTLISCINTVIPNSVTTIGAYAFTRYDDLTSVTIPNSVTTIGDYAFYSCSALTSVTIPNSVTSIGYCAFAGCRGLTEIYSMISEPFETPFDCWVDVNKNIPLYVPAGSKTKYQVTAEWNKFTNIIETANGDVTINSTTFPDDAFRSWVLNNISGANDGVLTNKEIVAVTEIDCSLQNIENMKGIEYFTALKSLYCNKNKITNLDVSNNTVLTKLSCWSNLLSTLDISKNTALTDLNCSSNQLTTLNVNHNTALCYLNCGDNLLTTLNISKNTSLTEFICGKNQLTTLDVSKNTTLTNLQCYDNLLTSLNVSMLTALSYFLCGGNQLTSLDISKSTSLKTLDCSRNQLTSLDVSKNTSLTGLNCYSNLLTILDVSKNTALTDLGCYSNQLATLDVSKNTKLAELYNYSNQLLYLDLSNNNSLRASRISPQSPTLTAVDISAEIGIPVPMGFNMAKVSNLKLNGTSVSGNVTTVNGQQYMVFATKGTAQSSIDGKTLTYTYNTGSSFSQAASMDVSVTLSYTATTVNYSLSIQSGSGGSITYNNTTITNTTKSFTIEQGASATITITPNYGYQLSRLTVNGLDVTSYVWNNSYTIDNITENTNVVASFEQIPASTFTLSIKAAGNGSITYNNLATRNTTRTFTMDYGSSATLTITPDAGYQLEMLSINGTNVTSYVWNNSYTIDNIKENTNVVASFEQIPTTTYSLSIQSGNGGTVSYEGTTISNTTKSFTINEGSSATINIYPNSGYQLSKMTVNGNNVTSYVTNNQYTINSITANTVVAVSFAASSTSFTQNGIYYHISSTSNKTLNVNSGAYNGHLTIPASVSYDGSTWSVRGAESGVFNSSSITAITWNPSYSINSDAFGTQTNPNLLLYVKSESYAPSNVPNVIVNGKSKKIVLTDAASGNDFDCPEAFTATEISYTHKYRMTTGIGECRGWETIALPFDVKLFTHESKETLIPFKVFSSASSGKPFWLYQLTSNGWQEAATIEANKPYIISMPNNKSYYNNYNMNGEVTFSAKNITVPKTEPIKTKFNDRTFVANFKSQQSAWDIYALNVNNEYSSYNEYLPEGSTFIRELRTVHPFEAFMMSTAANAKDMFSIFEDLTTAIKQLPTIGEDGNQHIRIYNLEGQLVKEARNVSEKEALKGLRHGLYIVNGKKRIIK